MKQIIGFVPHKITSVMLLGSALSACGGGAVTTEPPPQSSSAAESSAPVVSSQSSSSSSAVSSSSVAVSSSSVTVSSSSVASSSSVVSSSSSVPVSSSSQSESSSSASNLDAVNLLGSDGTFSKGQGLFTESVQNTVNARFTWNNEVSVSVPSTSPETWHVQLVHASIGVEANKEYTICFKAKATAPRTMSFVIDQAGTPGYDTLLGGYPADVELTTEYKQTVYTFTADKDDDTARLTMSFGVIPGGALGDVKVDDIGLYAGVGCGRANNVPGSIVGTGSDNIQGTPPITTEGNQVLFGGKTGSIAGMSLFWSSHRAGYRFYNQNVVEKLATDWNAKLIRAAMGVDDGVAFKDDPTTNKNRVTTIVDAAIANDMYVIIDWHTHNAEDDPKSLAINFFKDMARTYGTNNNVIYEIYNEPDCPRGISGSGCRFDNKTPWPVIKDYALPVIKAIREIDPDNLIIVGTPYYSQFVDEASEDPIVAADFPGNGDYAKNIAYTLHFYAATHKQELRNRATVALRNGIPLFVTEWGSVKATGNGDIDVAETDIWMDFLYDNNISHANWSVSDKAEGASILKPNSNGTNGWDASDLTESGRYVKDRIKNW